MTPNRHASVVPAGGGRVLDFRRRGVPPRRRRRSLLLALLKPLLTAFGMLALPAGLAAWVLTAPPFALRDLEVRGAADRVPEAWVRQALAPLDGRNLLQVSLDEVEELLQRNPWIESVEIAKEPPHRLRVVLTQRRPVALLLSAGGLAYADSSGRAIMPVHGPAEQEEARRKGLLIVRFDQPMREGGMTNVLAVAADIGRVEPDWSAKLSKIEVLGDDDYRLTTTALPFPVLVSRGEAGEKARRLLELLPQIARRYARVEAVDLRFSRRIVVQPGSGAPATGEPGV
jgi:cell division protein FtsQ